MPEQTILIIRHAEKPEPGGDSGVDSTGAPDPRSLTVRGWQRAGAWAELFVPAFGQKSALPTPTTLFASDPTGHHDSKSRRPEETITALAKKLDRAINLDFTKGQEDDLAVAIAEIHPVTLVCWEHEDIPAISRALAPDLQDIPVVWPGDRFNAIFRFRRQTGTLRGALTKWSPSCSRATRQIDLVKEKTPVARTFWPISMASRSAGPTCLSSSRHYKQRVTTIFSSSATPLAWCWRTRQHPCRRVRRRLTSD